ncbi:protein FAM193B isoform X2 [Trichomycterus rosablanca]|uniref:protein FAM193B isoform X2 n=1 Tax=Trichomycterus rosablanca TaxID=2290929 RepID=UPI002F3562AF
MARKKSKQQPQQQQAGAVNKEQSGAKSAGDAAPAAARSSQVPLSHSSSCKSQTCGNGYPEQSSVDWDPSSFLSARKLSGLWNSAHTGTGAHCTHNNATHSQQAGGTAGPTCHDKRSSHEAAGTKVCPYSHPAPPSATSITTPLSTSAEICKTSAKHFKSMCRRPTPPGEAFHPNEQHQPSADLSVPPNSPTGLSSQNSSLPLPTKPTSNQHAPFPSLAPSLGAKHSGGQDKPSACKNAKLNSSVMGCSHPCNGHNGGGGSNGATATSADSGHLTTSTCREQACKGHKLVNGSSCQQAACELEDPEDEDSGSERSSCASSTNQRDGKYCDCCYCEFFGHNAPPAAPTSRNYAEIREKLRSRLTRRKEEPPQRPDLDPALTSAIDHRDVDELLHFINATEPKRVNSAKAAKRARHKQKKKEKERALQVCSDQHSSSPQPEQTEEAEDEEHVPDGEAGRLLEWPQLELERVNSFLTSRLEEIKNTIKDSIRASFSMYDLNLDVSDFPKKAASLEGQRLLPHLNGSANEPQQIDLDLAPLSFKNFKKSVQILNGLTSDCSTNNISNSIAADTVSDVSTPTVPPATDDVPKPRDETKNTTGAGAKTKKGKKIQRLQHQQQQDQHPQEQHANYKSTKAPGNQEKTPEPDKVAKGGSKTIQQHAESQKTGNRKAEEGKPAFKNATAISNGSHHSGSNAHRGKYDGDARGNKSEHEVYGKNNANTPSNAQNSQQQPRGKNKKNRSKTDKSSSAIDDVFLPKDLDPTEMDEIDREVEYFKRFCLDSAKQTRQKVAVNWSNFSLKKMPSNAAQ